MGRGSNTPGKSGGGKYGASKPSRGQLNNIESRGDRIDFVQKDLGVSKEKASDYVDAVEYYTVDGYGSIRSGYNEEAKNVIDEFISKSPSYNGEIYRGMNMGGKRGREFVSQLQEGATIDMGGISSWSSDLKVAKKFSEQQGLDYRVLFKLQNKSGVGIQHISGFSEEAEVLQSSKSKFKIKSVKYSNNFGYFDTYEVELQEV